MSIEDCLSPLLTVMEDRANKSVGIPNFVSLALGTCELNKYTILFVVVTVVDVDDDDASVQNKIQAIQKMLLLL